MVGDEVRLDQPDRPAVLDDQVLLDVSPTLDRRPPLLDRDLERVAPPLRHVLAAEPGFDQRQVGVVERAELDHARRRSESSAFSSCTFSVRQASA
jgi:hypothetical protein